MKIGELIFCILFFGATYIAFTACVIHMFNFIIGQFDESGKLKDKVKCFFRTKWLMFIIVSLPPMNVLIFVLCGCYFIFVFIMAAVEAIYKSLKNMYKESFNDIWK